MNEVEKKGTESTSFADSVKVLQNQCSRRRSVWLASKFFGVLFYVSLFYSIVLLTLVIQLSDTEIVPACEIDGLVETMHDPSWDMGTKQGQVAYTKEHLMVPACDSDARANHACTGTEYKSLRSIATALLGRIS